jgi:hypothetical protein
MAQQASADRFSKPRKTAESTAILEVRASPRFPPPTEKETAEAPRCFRTPIGKTAERAEQGGGNRGSPRTFWGRRLEQRDVIKHQRRL